VAHDEGHKKGQLDMALKNIFELLDDDSCEQQADAEGDEPAGAAARDVNYGLAAAGRLVVGAGVRAERGG
jgi:hypothetical protein